MELRVKEQFICYMFVVILFLTGMCVEIPPADATFSYTKETPGASSNVSIFRDGSNVISLERICTVDMLRCDIVTNLCGNRGRTLVRRFLRTVAFLFAVAVMLSQLLYYRNEATVICRKRASNHATIVRYIQQKDGKK